MRYKTTIEVITEAKTRTEAMEIVDDYLTGNLVSGIDMKCTTRPVRAYGKGVISVTVISVIVAVGILALIHPNPSAKKFTYGPAISAVQPVLKTSAREMNNSDFKKEWEKKQTEQALELIRKTD
jgi:hypothetical protein